MGIGFIKKFKLPTGLALSITLIGILLLGGILYHRAVRAQRFLEPALAISQPRIEFSQNIDRLIGQVFGTTKIKGLRITTDSILIEEPVLFGRDGNPSPQLIKKLSRTFLFMLKDPAMRDRIDFILISTRHTLNPAHEMNEKERLKMQTMAGDVLHAVFMSEPELEMNYSMSFASTAMSVQNGKDEPMWVEFRIIPTEQLHIDVLQRLGKYVY